MPFILVAGVNLAYLYYTVNKSWIKLVVGLSDLGGRMSCRGFYHQVGNSRYSGRILPTLSSSYGRIIPTCERFFVAGWIYHLSSKTPSVYMPVWWDSSCFPTFLQNRAVYHPVRQYLMRGWQRTGSISGVDGSARAVFRAWMAAHGQYFARGWQRTAHQRTAVFCRLFLLFRPRSNFATLRDFFSGIIKIPKDQELLQIYTVVSLNCQVEH